MTGRIIQWLEGHPKTTWFLILAYMSIIFFMSSIPYLQQPLPSKKYAPIALHILEYAILGFLLSVSIKTGGERRLAIIGSILIATFYGVTDEIHQFFVPGRTADVYDVLSDFIGASIGSIFRALFKN